MSEALIFVLAGAFATATPLLLAALGELISEKSGVLNLSVEGMMAVGAATGFVLVESTGSHSFAMLGGAVAGMLLSCLFALLVLRLLANQIATGLAIGLLGLGVSALLGQYNEGATTSTMAKLDIPVLSKIPLLGPILFHQDIIVYLTFGFAAVVGWFMYRTKAGLMLRVVGENPQAAHSLGLHPTAIRFAAILFGGAMAGLAGAYASTVLTPLWSQGMIAGRGWIAIALVVFGSWRPARVMAGAYFFGAVQLLDLAVQSVGITIPSQVMTCVPYVSTIVILAIVSRDTIRIRLNAPMSLGETYQPAT